MYNIKTLNNISSKGLERLSSNLFAVDEEGAQPDGILVRSAAMQDMALPESLLGIARAGAGVNNIPVDKCSEAGIVVFNTPGANANAVKELVLGGLVLASRKVGKGMEWAKTLAGQGDAIGKGWLFANIVGEIPEKYELKEQAKPIVELQGVKGEKE